jgi:putative transposase
MTIQAFLQEVYCSWLNQIEIWFSILVRKLLRRTNFTSTADLKTRILDFIRLLAKVLGRMAQVGKRGE